MAKLTDAQKAKLQERMKALTADEREGIVEVLADEILKALGKTKKDDDDDGGFFKNWFKD